MADMKQKALELFARGSQGYKTYKGYKAKYDKYKKLYDLGKNLINPDTRTATVFKEALKYLLKAAGEALETDLTKHPYFILNQKGMEVLWEAITASDTIDNARKQLFEAEKKLNALESKASEFSTNWGKTYDADSAAIKRILTGQNSLGGYDWTNYVNRLSTETFWQATRADAELEVEDDIKSGVTLMDDLLPTAAGVFKHGSEAFAAYAALTAAGGDIALAQKTYDAKIKALADSKSTISSGFGKLEQERRYNEQGFDALENKKGGGEPLDKRVQTALADATKVTGYWSDFVDACGSEYILLWGSRGGVLPWEMSLPDK